MWFRFLSVCVCVCVGGLSELGGSAGGSVVEGGGDRKYLYWDRICASSMPLRRGGGIRVLGINSRLALLMMIAYSLCVESDE